MHFFPTVMNPINASLDRTAPLPQLPPRPSFSCDRHPTEQFFGFCPSCLCERLTTLDHSSSNTPSSSRRPSSASAAIKALFSSSSTKLNNFPHPPKPSKPTSFFSELRRTKSFSASKNEALGLTFEPQRKSCDVRVRSSSTLLSLFTLDDVNKTPPTNNNTSELVLEEDSIDLKKNVEIGAIGSTDDEDEGDEIRPVPDSQLVDNFVEIELNNNEIVEEEVLSVCKLKPMKDHIDLNTLEKKNSRGGGGGFWAAASVFKQKWQKWRRKQKIKKQNDGESVITLPVEKPIARQYRETQSEIADYGFGRRSCDTGPRFSLDAGRISFDDPRHSLDEPRASWSLPRMVTPMVSLKEDAYGVHVPRSDMQIPVDDECEPGGSTQTRDYYLDSSSSSSRRRKSLDRSSSIRKTSEIDDHKVVPNAKVSPTTADCFQGAKVLVGERDFKGSNSYSLRDDCSDTFELGNGDVKEEEKKSRRWSWRIWGFMHRRNKDEDEEDKYSRLNGVERSLSESWQDKRREENGVLRDGFNRNVLRSKSSVSWRNGNSVRKSSLEINGKRKKKDDVVLDRNRSLRYSSPNHIDNGLLRFYLTPLRNSRRGGGLGKTKSNNSKSITRSVLGL